MRCRRASLLAETVTRAPTGTAVSPPTAGFEARPCSRRSGSTGGGTGHASAHPRVDVDGRRTSSSSCAICSVSRIAGSVPASSRATSVCPPRRRRRSSTVSSGRGTSRGGQSRRPSQHLHQATDRGPRRGASDPREHARSHALRRDRHVGGGVRGRRRLPAPDERRCRRGGSRSTPDPQPRRDLRARRRDRATDSTWTTSHADTASVSTNRLPTVRRVRDRARGVVRAGCRDVPLRAAARLTGAYPTCRASRNRPLGAAGASTLNA